MQKTDRETGAPIKAQLVNLEDTDSPYMWKAVIAPALGTMPRHVFFVTTEQMLRELPNYIEEELEV